MNKLTLSSGSSSFGSQMGRRNSLPADFDNPIKLRMVKLKWIDFDYDEFGAYWGRSNDFIYCAWNEDSTNPIYIFERANTRQEAKVAVLGILPNARFYN